MPTAFTGPLVPAQPFVITLPTSATINDAGEVVVDLSSYAGGAGIFTSLAVSGLVAAAAAVTVGTTLAVTGASTLAAVNASGTVAAAGAVTVGTTLGVTGASTLAATSTTALTATTSLTVTGANIVGLEYNLPVIVTSLVGAGAEVAGAPVPFPGTIVKIWSRLNAEITTGDAVLTTKIGATNITNGVITIAFAGSGAGDIDSATPTAANVVVAGDSINATVSGTQDNAVGAVLMFVIRRSA